MGALGFGAAIPGSMRDGRSPSLSLSNEFSCGFPCGRGSVPPFDNKYEALYRCFVRARFVSSRTRVPHIWPDSGQMWEKATVGARLPIVPENFRFKAIYPHVGAFFAMARLHRLLKNSCFVSVGHRWVADPGWMKRGSRMMYFGLRCEH
jgi:hypothetical protein